MSLIATFGTIQSVPQLRRVRRDEAARPAFNKPDPYAQLMACWVDYMRVDDRDLGSRGMKLTSDAEVERDVHAQQRLADLQLGAAVNAMVDSLSMQHRWAVYKSQGMTSVWRFPSARFEDVLLDARAALEEKLRNNSATRLQFAR